MADNPSNNQHPEGFCVNHPDEPAAVSCVKCGNRLCCDCRYYFYGKWYCEPCFTHLRKHANRRNGWMVFFACHLLATAFLMGALTALGYKELFVWYAVRNPVESWLLVALWHIPDVAIGLAAISALVLKRWGGGAVRLACTMSAGRALAWLLATAFGPGEGVRTPVIYLYAALLVYSLVALAFFSSRTARDEFRAIRP